MCENSNNNQVMFLGEPCTVDTDKHGVRANPRKAEDDPSIEAKFKQGVNNPSVREHDHAVYEQQALTDSIIEDTTEQLNAAQQERDLLKTDLELAKQALDKKNIEYLRLQNAWIRVAQNNARLRRLLKRSTQINTELRIENYKLKNRFWYRVGQWLKREWEADIYHPSC